MNIQEAPSLAGVHHLKLPVTDLAQSAGWYRSRLGYGIEIEFVEQGTLMGYVLRHPNGGPELCLRLDPDRARAAAGFDYFSIGVPDKATMDDLAGRLSALGEKHAGVHWASVGWILPELHDPDGHEVRFYTMTHHTELDPTVVTSISDPRETAQRRSGEISQAGTECRAPRPAARASSPQLCRSGQTSRTAAHPLGGRTAPHKVLYR